MASANSIMVLVDTFHQHRHLLGRRQLIAQLLGQVRNHLVAGDADRLAGIPQSILDHRPVLLLAEDDADGAKRKQDSYFDTSFLSPNLLGKLLQQPHADERLVSDPLFSGDLFELDATRLQSPTIPL